MYCWGAAKRSQAAITELLLFRKSTGIIIRYVLPAFQRLCANGSFVYCQVRVFVKQQSCLFSLLRQNIFKGCFASEGKISAETILPFVEHDWLKWRCHVTSTLTKLCAC